MPRRPRDIALWALQILLALAFVLPVYRKLASVPESVHLFDQIGAGQWLRYAVGLLELALLIGLLIPGLAGVAALGIVGTMVGAVITEIAVESGRWLLPLVLLVLAAGLAWLRRADTAALLHRVRPARA